MPIWRRKAENFGFPHTGGGEPLPERGAERRIKATASALSAPFDCGLAVARPPLRAYRVRCGRSADEGGGQDFSHSVREVTWFTASRLSGP